MPFNRVQHANSDDLIPKVIPRSDLSVQTEHRKSESRKSQNCSLSRWAAHTNATARLLARAVVQTDAQTDQQKTQNERMTQPCPLSSPGYF